MNTSPTTKDTGWTCVAEGPYVVTRWAGQEARKLCKPKNVGRANETTAEQQAIKEAAAQCAKRAKKENRVVKPMLAQPYSAKKFVPGSTVQPKLDGVRCLAYWQDGRVVLQSRGGDDYPVEHIRQAVEAVLPRDAMLDGELYIHGMSLQQIVSLVKRPQPDSKALQYWVYDSPGPEKWQRRDNRIDEILPASTSALWVTPREYVGCEEQVHNIDRNNVRHGFEGSIIRAPNGLYGFGKRSWDLMKLKQWQDAEFEIVDWKTGVGKYANIPLFICFDPSAGLVGATFPCCPPGSLEDRRALLPVADSFVGKKLTVKFFDRTDAGLPHFPVGVHFRGDGE